VQRGPAPRGQLRRPTVAAVNLPESRRSVPQIQMPGDKVPSDQDDRHFANF